MSSADALYLPSSTSLLRDALYSVHRAGHAWLYVVYESDPVRTWGTRKVKLIAGGKIVREVHTSSGSWTGAFTTLRYEVVARHIFNNLIGEDSTEPYRVVVETSVQPSTSVHRKSDVKSKSEASSSEQPFDDLFGEPCSCADQSDLANRNKSPPFIPQVKLGCVVTFANEHKETETWFVNDAKYFSKFHFTLTEYQSRQPVQMVMAALGFVEDPSLGSLGQPLPLQTIVTGHIRTIIQSINAVVRVTSSREVFLDNKEREDDDHDERDR